MGKRVVVERNEQNALTDNITEIDTMLVRDLFAGLIAAAAMGLNNTVGKEASIAAQAYDLADAMIAERSKRI